jgi:hypothetical protein
MTAADFLQLEALLNGGFAVFAFALGYIGGYLN